MAQFTFDATQVAPSSAPEAVPDNWYVVRITNSTFKPTSSKNGHYLEIENTILEGKFAGSKIFDRLNLDNPNPMAKEIAYRELSSYCHAIGIMQIQDTQQLHNIPFRVRVVKVPGQPKKDAGGNIVGQHDPSNEIKARKHISEAVEATPEMATAVPNFATPNPMTAPAGHVPGTPVNPPPVTGNPPGQASPAPWAQQQQTPPAAAQTQPPVATQTPPPAATGAAPPWAQQQPATGTPPAGATQAPPWAQSQA